MDQFVCPVGTNEQCQALAGVGEAQSCGAVANATLCAQLASTGKPGFIEAPYLMESENAFDGRYLYVVVMDGPMEKDYIGDVGYKGQSGIVFGTNLYFSGQMPTNATVLKIDPSNGDVLWNYTRPIYYRGGIIATGGMVVTQWPDGKMIFLSSTTGQVIDTIDLNVPLLAPMSIAPDSNGVMHILIDSGGSNHPVLGEAGLHGALGRGDVTPGDVISLTIQPPHTSLTTATSTTTGPGPQLFGNLQAYELLATVALAVIVVAGVTVFRHRRGR